MKAPVLPICAVGSTGSIISPTGRGWQQLSTPAAQRSVQCACGGNARRWQEAASAGLHRSSCLSPR
eukprot:920353-Prymnesium_polylepis.1